MHLQVVEGSDKLFLCILCQLISWLHPDNQIIVLVQFWHIAYFCWDISADLILVKVTLFCCLTDTHGYSMCCIYQIIMSSIQNIRVVSECYTIE